MRRYSRCSPCWRPARLDTLFGTYDPVTDDFNSVLDIRGMPTLLRWDAGASVLELIVPGAIPPGAVRFDVGSGELSEALDQLESWLEGDFDTATAPAGPDQTGVGLLGGYAKGGPFGVATVELPIDHRFNLRRLPRFSPIVSFPVTATFTEGQWSAMGSLGLGFQYRPFDWWALTPIFRVGVVGSIDVGAAALLYSGTVTSNVHFDLGRFLDGADGIRVHVVNQGGFAKTAQGVTIGDFELDYDLTNGVFRNGGYVTSALGESGWGLRFFGNDVRWTGDDLYLESHAELGLAVARLAQVAGFPYESLSLSASYLGDFGDYDGVAVLLRGRF